MKRLIIISILFSLIVSCQPSDSEAYYNFNSLDYEFIPEQYQEIGKTFIFKNAQNEEVRIKPLFYTLNKNFESGYGFGQPTQTESYYYDDLWIQIELVDVEIPIESYCDRIVIRINKSPYKGLFVDLEIPTYNELGCYTGGLSEFFPFEGLTQMVINNKTYSKVKIVTTNHYFTLYNDSHIDKVYYDMDNGIIGFDDTQNNEEFRLVSE